MWRDSSQRKERIGVVFDEKAVCVEGEAVDSEIETSVLSRRGELSRSGDAEENDDTLKVSHEAGLSSSVLQPPLRI
jgi:hypothetical protein